MYRMDRLTTMCDGPRVPTPDQLTLMGRLVRQPSLPVEPAPSRFAFPPSAVPDEHGKVVVGGDLDPGTVLAAYRSGLFPMRQKTGELAWWSPDPRGVLRLDALRVSNSLRRARRRFEIRVDTAFEAVIDACAERDEGEYAWITGEVRQAYVALHHLGWAHSIEAWTIGTPDDPPELAGGLYGVAIGGLFAGESMFHRRRDASKVALVGLVEALAGSADPEKEPRLIDVQWLTPHLASLGAVEVPRYEYLAVLASALELPLPAAFLRESREFQA
jgi:leucyl/phenylalanyl-tRNA--protein transferase